MYQPGDPNNLMAVSENTRWVTGVGVVRSVRLEDLTDRVESAGAYYFAAGQSNQRNLTLALRVAGNHENVLPAIRATLQQLDPAVPLTEVRTMGEYTSRALLPQRTALLLVSSFGMVSLFLAALGISGVLAHVVTQRSREIGIRVALGSTQRRIIELVLIEGLILVASGLLLGLFGAALLRNGAGESGLRSEHVKPGGCRRVDPASVLSA
jgi:putative ABC transport system permease protein